MSYICVRVIAGFILTIVVVHSLSDCPDTWVAFDGSCYLFEVDKPMTFYNAENFCRQHHEGHLVHVDSVEENNFLKDFFTKLKASSYWLGITDDAVEGTWRWYDTDDLLTFTDWYPNQPGTDGPEDCGVFYAGFNYKWGDIACSTLFEPVCEISGVHDDQIVG